MLLRESEHPLPLLLQVAIIDQIAGIDQKFGVAHMFVGFLEGIRPWFKA